MRRAVFIGKWRMPHMGHMWLFNQKLDKGIPILIMIRDIPATEEDPLEPLEIKEILEKIYALEVDMDESKVDIYHILKREVLF